MALQGVLQILGPTGAGKTTVCELLAQELQGRSVLLVDAEPDQELTRLLTLNTARETLTDLLSRMTATRLARNEAMDWSFHDLTQTVGPDLELLTVGTLPPALPPGAERPLKYGFQRLLQAYAYVVIDGGPPALSTLLPECHRVLVATPDTPALPLPAREDIPNLLLNHMPTVESRLPLGHPLNPLIDGGQVRLIGKLPKVPAPHELGDLFHNVFLRLDLPYRQTPFSL